MLLLWDTLAPTEREAAALTLSVPLGEALELGVPEPEPVPLALCVPLPVLLPELLGLWLALAPGLRVPDALLLRELLRLCVLEPVGAAVPLPEGVPEPEGVPLGL